MSTLRTELIARLARLNVDYRPVSGREDGFAGLWFGGKAFAHFHNDNELDIRLTAAIIEREGLVHPAGSVHHPKRSMKSPWIEVRFTTPAHLERVVQLVKLAMGEV